MTGRGLWTAGYRGGGENIPLYLRSHSQHSKFSQLYKLYQLDISDIIFYKFFMDINELRKLAMACRAGEWSVSPDNPLVVITGDGAVVGKHAKNNIFASADEAEAAYIAAVSPAVILKFIDDIELMVRYL